MSLLYWLPMLGTLENQGLSNAQPVNHGATVGTSGKLGKCYDFSGTAQYIDTGFKESFGTGDFSISVWFKLTDSGSRTYQPIISNKTTGAASVGCAIYYNHSQQKFLWSTADGSGATEVWMAQTYSYSGMLNTWHHIVMVRNSSDAKKGYFYIDGVRYELASVPAIRNVTNTTYNLQIGDIGSHDNANYLWTGSLCDLRIYDMALSPREIKEISKGLVLHYPLNREGFGQDNLLSRYVSPGQQNPEATADWGRTKYYGDYGIIIPATENADTYFRLFLRKQLTSNAVYTISCQVSGLIDGTYYLFPLFAQGNSSMGVLRLDHNGFNSMTFTMTYGTQTAVTVGSETVYICFLDDAGRSIATGQGPITVTNFKIEEGSVATPFVPAPTDALYTKMGLNLGNENLLSKSSLNPSNWTHIYPNCTKYTGDGYDNMFEMVTTSSYENVYLPITVTSGQQYTFSLDFQVLDSFSLWQSSRPFSFQVLSTVPTNTDTFNNVLGSILVGNTAMSAPQRGSTTFTPTGGTVWLNIPGSYYKDGADSYNKRVKFSHFKLEKGATATPWVSATSDSEKFGNTVFDTSGYKYDGIYAKFDDAGSFSWQSDSPRYSVACKLNSDGISNYNRAGAAFIRGTVPITTPNTLTVAFWCYGQLSYGGGYHGLFSTSNNTAASDYQASALNHRDNGFDVNSSDGSNHLRLSLNIIVGEWHHYAITYDGQTAKSYRDGVLRETKAFSSATALGSFQYVFLGLSGAGGAYRKSNASYSDFRLYVTALSADDILELYHTPITLSNNGTLLTQGEYVEV